MFNYTFEEAISALEINLKEEKFGILWMFDIKEKLEEKGLEFEKEFKVLEVCNPQEAQKVLFENEMSEYYLPCKIVVYESKGKTKIGMLKPTSLIEMLNDDKMEQFAKDIEDPTPSHLPNNRWA